MIYFYWLSTDRECVVKRNSNTYTHHFPDGKTLKFKYKDGHVEKIEEKFFPKAKFYEALQAARNYLLLPNPKLPAPKKIPRATKKRLSPMDRLMLAEATANEARLRAMLPDY